MSSIMDLINEMEDYFESCNKVPFSSKIMVNPEVIYELITDMRLKIPEEIKRCQRVLDEKDKIIMEAKQHALNVEKETENKMLEMVNEHEIMQQAYSEAETILTEAKNTSRELKLGAYEYADEILVKIEEAARATMIETQSAYQQMEAFMNGQVEMLLNNRQDLQDRKVKRKSS
ncbi:ATPase [Vallitalea pronyensis]|uniref:ATPase n=1 Tax=Vallitalea pronyensis TaxID=1348613 RepID=A0A8J8MJG0_9FIRM|nr:ATPase [Vallitalea pronyensis]QUI22937.1 ATPase [Vallitalea pronyensis]